MTSRGWVTKEATAPAKQVCTNFRDRFFSGVTTLGIKLWLYGDLNSREIWNISANYILTTIVYSEFRSNSKVYFLLLKNKYSQQSLQTILQ